MKKTLVIGSAVCDVILPLNHLPARNEDINFYHQEMSLGGCASNVCGILRHFQIPFVPFLPVGTGIYGDFVRKQLALRGFESCCPASEDENGCCYCLVEPDGERTFLCLRGAEYLFRREWFSFLEESGQTEQTDSVYVCGLELEAATGPVILDFLERHSNFRIYFAPSARICCIPAARMNRILNLHPILHLNAEEALRYTASVSGRMGRMEGIADRPADMPQGHRGADDPSCGAASEAVRKACIRLSKRTGNAVIITMGASGSMLTEGPGCPPVLIPAYPAQPGGDTIGAGDSHIGSVIALIKKGFSLEEAVSCAGIVSAAVVSAAGSTLSENRFQEVLALMQKQMPERIL